MFFNAAIQSLSNAATWSKKNLLRLRTMLGFASIGYLIPVIVSMLGDDDDLERYNNLPDYVRKNHLCIPMGDKFVKIPLPIERERLRSWRSIVQNGKPDQSYGRIAS